MGQEQISNCFVFDEDRKRALNILYTVSAGTLAATAMCSSSCLFVCLSLLGPFPLSRVVVIVVVDIDAQAARDSTASDIW